MGTVQIVIDRANKKIYLFSSISAEMFKIFVRCLYIFQPIRIQKLELTNQSLQGVHTKQFLRCYIICLIFYQDYFNKISIDKGGYTKNKIHTTIFKFSDISKFSLHFNQGDIFTFVQWRNQDFYYAFLKLKHIIFWERKTLLIL